jgi:type II secretory pathway component GspD/PulD (secretin)
MSMGWIVYPTGNKDPEVMVAKVLEMIRKQQVRPKLEMIVDPSAKRILLRGDKAAVQDSISKLDGLKRSGEKQIFHVPIMFQSAAEIAKALIDEFSPKYSNEELAILHDSRTNTVMIAAKPEIVSEVRARLSILDQRPAGSNPFEGVRILRRLRLKNIDATNAFARVREFLPKDTTVDFISYDPTDNSIVARASEAELDAIEKFLASIDKKE